MSTQPDSLATPPTTPTAPVERALVVVPTYNEAANIERLLTHVCHLDPAAEPEYGLALARPVTLDVLVVDDGSPDGTADLVRRVQVAFPGRVHLVERAGKLGLGTAYVRGFRFGLIHGYDHVCEMDADFSHNPDDLLKLIAAIQQGADVAIGSRYVGGVRIMNWPLSRLVLSYGAGVYTRAITGLPVLDVTAGFKCFHRRVLEAIDLDRVKSNGYSFQIELTYRAWRQGFKIAEVPIVFTERTEGQSKMSKAIVREAAWKVWELRMRQLVGRL
ncbi:MAG: polyprenol monophosphomannose synthase [Bacteroidota bacterium]